MRFFIELSYNGDDFHGWQVQPNVNTVQAEINKALSIILNATIEVVGAGRTDTGVHAKQMFAHFDFELVFDAQKLKQKLNSFLPKDISIYNIIPIGMCIRLTLLSKGVVENIPENSFNQYQKLNRNLKYKLNSEQEKCLSEIKKKGNKFNVHVLDGVTGSGKTLVYFNRLREIINRGYQALIMLPEIGLTTQFKKRFIDFFGFEPAIWHSATSKKNKKIIWRGIVEKKIRVVVGARSSLFLPFAKLGIIIVDEEHDASYKQDEGIIYNARDMAVSRGSFEKIPVLLITSIPSGAVFLSPIPVTSDPFRCSIITSSGLLFISNVESGAAT